MKFADKKISKANPIHSLFQVESFLQKITCAKNTCNLMCIARKSINKKISNPH